MARGWLTALACLVATPAVAGSGPWTLEPDDMSLYAGAGHFRWGAFAGAGGSYQDVFSIGAPVLRTDVIGIATYGLLPGGELEVRAGFGWSTVPRDDATRCEGLGQEVCETTTGFIPLDVRFKGRFVDELTGAPLSASLTLGVRLGDWTADARHRLTALGEGSTDLFAIVDLGRTGSIGSVGYSTFINGGYFFRFPVAEVGYLDDLRVPGDDIVAAGEFVLYPRSWLGIGPAVDFLHRISGVDWGDIDTADVDRYTALSITLLKAGAKISVRSAQNVSFNLGVFWTVYGRNNPANGFAISAGVGIFLPKKRREKT